MSFESPKVKTYFLIVDIHTEWATYHEEMRNPQLKHTLWKYMYQILLFLFCFADKQRQQLECKDDLTRTIESISPFHE